MYGVVCVLCVMSIVTTPHMTQVGDVKGPMTSTRLQHYNVSDVHIKLVATFDKKPRFGTSGQSMRLRMRISSHALRSNETRARLTAGP
jgi:hypothetical protein